MGPKLRLGTRGSRLALAQVEIVRGLLPGVEIEPVVIRTSGDRGDRDVRGAFVREIQLALLSGEIDVALHCLKDLPTDAVPGLTLAAYLEREDARDAIIIRERGTKISHGGVVGTGSLRRTSQIAATRPDVTFKRLVGNVDTRLRKLIEGEYDAIVLAIAGLHRLGVMPDWETGDYGSLAVHPKSSRTIVPAPGQGVLVLETRADDERAKAAVAPLHHTLTASFARAERAFLAALGGGCSVPVGAFAEAWHEPGMALTTWVSMPDGSGRAQPFGMGSPDDPEELGQRVAAEFNADEKNAPLRDYLATLRSGNGD